MDKQLSVIIVNYNGQKYLKDCLDSLYRHLEGINSEIVLLDNNSADNSCAYIKEHYPEVTLIESSRNLGFGKGNNEAVRHASGRYLLLLNNDTIIQQNLKPVFQVVKNDSTIGAAGIKMLNGKGQYLVATGKFLSPGNIFRMKNMFRMGKEFATGNFSKGLYDVDWITGSFMLMPADVYRKVGGFDEDYFLYVEDVDLCKKIADAGYRRVFLTQYSYIHFVGHNKSKNHLLINGNRLYIEKHMKGITKLAALAALFVNASVKKIKA